MDNQNKLLRIDSIVGANGLLPISRSQWWKGCREGIYPKPKKLGPNITVWALSDIEHLIANGIEPSLAANAGGLNA